MYLACVMVHSHDTLKQEHRSYEITGKFGYLRVNQILCCVVCFRQVCWFSCIEVSTANWKVNFVINRLWCTSLTYVLFWWYFGGLTYIICELILNLGGGPRVVVSTAAFHARVRGSVPGLGGLKETKMFLPHPRVKVSIVGSLRDREVACSVLDRQGSNFEYCVWRTVSSESSHHP